MNYRKELFAAVSYTRRDFARTTGLEYVFDGKLIHKTNEELEDLIISMCYILGLVDKDGLAI